MVREDFYAAVWALFSPLISTASPPVPTPATPFVSGSRQLVHFDQVDIVEMPALFQNQVSETPWLVSNGGQVGTIFEIELYVYCPSDQANVDTVPSTFLNPCMDGLDTQIPRLGNPKNVVLLGAPVEMVAGKIEYFEGLLSDKSIAKRTIYIRAPFC